MHPNKKYKSIIITATWNRLDLLQQFLEALKRQNDKNFGIVVVDNGSEDGSREFIIEQAKKSINDDIPVWALLLKENAGFALPNNLGITFTTEFLDSEYIVLLNNDTIPNPNFIKTLHNKAESYLRGSDRKNFETDKKLFPFLSKKDDWKIGSFAPLVENYYTPDKVDAAGIKVSPDGNAINRGAGEKLFKFKREKEVFGPSGSAVLHLRKALIDVALLSTNIARLKGWDRKSPNEEMVWSVGIDHNRSLPKNRSLDLDSSHNQFLPIKEFFSSRYFAYFEDVDLAWRLRLRLWGTVYVPSAKILHYHSATAKAYSPFKSYHVHRNQYFNILRDFPSYFIFVGLWNAFKRYYFLLESLIKKRGPAAQVAKNSSKMTVFTIVIKGWGSVLINLIGLIRERIQIQSTRLIDNSEFNDLLDCPRFRASLDKMIFETQNFSREQKNNDENDKDRAS